MLKRNRSSVELLPHDVVELILERLPAMSLQSFKFVSKQWKSTIGSKRFQERQFIRRTQSLDDPDVFFLSLDPTDEGLERSRIELGSSIFFTLKFPFPTNRACYGTCDGLICTYGYDITSNIVANPATKWHRSFPLSRFQQMINKGLGPPIAKLGFGKDKFRGTYKAVWLYNSSGLNKATICEVFDFTTNAWRYVLPASPCRILDDQNPVYFDGSLHWLSECKDGPPNWSRECKETKVVSFDLHTETFRVLCKAPFAHVDYPQNVIMCILDNRLSVTKRNGTTQVIWSLFDNMTWKKMCCIDLSKTFSCFGKSCSKNAVFPVAILEKNKLLLHGREREQPLVIHDLLSKSYYFVFQPTTTGYFSFYFDSLLSL